MYSNKEFNGIVINMEGNNCWEKMYASNFPMVDDDDLMSKIMKRRFKSSEIAGPGSETTLEPVYKKLRVDGHVECTSEPTWKQTQLDGQDVMHPNACNTEKLVSFPGNSAEKLSGPALGTGDVDDLHRDEVDGNVNIETGGFRTEKCESGLNLHRNGEDYIDNMTGSEAEQNKVNFVDNESFTFSCFQSLNASDESTDILDTLATTCERFGVKTKPKEESELSKVSEVRDSDIGNVEDKTDQQGVGGSGRNVGEKADNLDKLEFGGSISSGYEQSFKSNLQQRISSVEQNGGHFRKEDVSNDTWGCSKYADVADESIKSELPELEVDKVEECDLGTITSDKHEPETETACIKQEVGYLSEFDNVQGSCIAKNEGKKSRKQTVPRRYTKIESLESDVHKTTCVDNEKEIESLPKEKMESSENESNAEQIKSEKSRKQAKPKRILENVMKKEFPAMGVGDENLGDGAEGKSVSSWVNKKEKHGELDEETLETSKKEPALRPKPSFVDNNASDEFKMNASYFSPSLPSLYDSPKPNSDLVPMPGFGFHAENLDLYSKLSPLLSSSSSQSFLMGPGLSDELENINVIRQLREIRCSKYRKISVAEKREIAEYAKINGVSNAANVYNVSKSAVSMWTRQDLDELEELDEKRKRNCMLGNERFEALCAKVRDQRENKFKGLSKNDKFEVSRYAKLVGVREMARCLDVALGTVSGWMRQFPYKVNTEEGENSEKGGNSKMGDNSVDEGKSKNTCGSGKGRDFEKRGNCEKENDLEKTSEGLLNESGFDKMIDPENGNKSEKGSKRKRSRDLKELKKDANRLDISQDDSNDSIGCMKKSSLDQKDISTTNDEVDHMIAETIYKPPDVEKLYEDVKDLMAGTELEGDEEFKTLFGRVVVTKSFKYKTLTPADKIAVCRYGRRVGVRKVGRVLGLATGTLSGWNTKYSAYLENSSPILDVSGPDGGEEISKGDDSTSSNGSSAVNTPGKSAMSLEIEKNEIMAVKCLFKDQFNEIAHKLEIARSMKFRNISVGEKIEIVKCSKLVGIRPTARVLNIPIGTLSGWITKYTHNLHPAYNISQSDQMNIYGDNFSAMDNSGMNYAGLGMSPGTSGAWPAGLMANSGLSLNSEVATGNLASVQHSYVSTNDNEDTIESRSCGNNEEENEFEDVGHSEATSETNKDEVGKNSSASMETDGVNFEEEAKKLAQQYLQNMYTNMNLPTM